MKAFILIIFLLIFVKTIAQDPQSGWSFEYSGDDFTNDALLDLRYLNEATAGDNGFIQLSADGSHFVNDAGEMRFWAINGGSLVRGHDPDLTDGDLATYARFLAKMGVNMIRFHGEIFSTTLDINEPNKEEADYIWRVVAAMKKEGIYTTISPYWPAHIDFIPTQWDLGDYKGDVDPWELMYFDDHFRDAYKSWVNYLYTEINPHTGIALKDDPAVAIVQIINEDGVFFWTINNVLPSLTSMIQEQLFDWAVAKHGTIENAFIVWDDTSLPDDDIDNGKLGIIDIWLATDDPNVPTPTPGFSKRHTDQMNFFADTQKDFYQDIYDYYKSIGCKQILNASNWKTASAIRMFDLERWTNLPAEVMAVNRYYDPGHFGPNAGWRIERGHHYQGTSNMYSPNKLPINIKQVANKPFVVTESGWNLPNQHQAEGPFLISAYQSLTGVDAFYWFNPSSTTFEDDPYFPYWGNVNGEEPMFRWTTSIPGQVGMFPANALAFRKGFIKQGTPVLHEERTFQSLINREIPKITEDNSFDPNRDNYEPNPEQGETEYSPLTYLAGPVEVVYEGDPDNTTVAPQLGDLVNTSEKKVTSITGELTWDYEQGICILDAPKTQGICGFPKTTPYKLSDITITTSNDYVVINAVSMDDKLLKDSEKILIQIGTIYRPTGWKEVPTNFTPSEGAPTIEGFKIESLGQMPWKCANTEVKIEIKNTKVKSAHLLNSSGYEDRDFIVNELSDGLSFNLPSASMYVVLDTRPSEAPTGLLDKKNDSIKIYPNPNNGNFLIQFSEELEHESIDKIEVMDLFGQSIQTFNYHKEGSFELNAAAGTYIINFLLESGEIYSQRFIIN